MAKTPIAIYQQLLSFQDAHFSLIEHEDAMVATVYYVTQASGEECILKVCTREGDYLREAYFLKYFADKIPVPRILALIEPQEGIDGAILMTYVPGKLLRCADLSDALAYEIGAILATIHSIATSGYGDLIAPESLSADPRLSFMRKFEEGLGECQSHLSFNVIEQCRKLFDQYLGLLTTVDGPRIIHRDFRPGNLIILNNRVQGVIDWSAGKGGFAEEDFGSLEMGQWSSYLAYKHAFFAGYASCRPLPHYKELIPLLALSKAIGVIGFTLKRGTWETRDANIYKYYRKVLEHVLRRAVS